MDSERNPLLNWPYFCQPKTMEDLKQSLLYTTLELEATRLQAQEELQKRDDLLNHLKTSLTNAIKEKDEAQQNYQKLLETFLISQQHPPPAVPPPAAADPLSGVSSIEDCEESIFSSPKMDPNSQSPPLNVEYKMELVEEKFLPENGKFLQAVMKAGPLLENLLLAGPLPKWKHPPPPLQSVEIPPVSIHNNNNNSSTKKRGLCEDFEHHSSPINKIQRTNLPF